MSNKQRVRPTQSARTVVKPRFAPHGGVCVAFIHPGETSAYFTTSMLAMLMHDMNGNRNIVAMLNEWSSANVSATRNALTKIFLEDKPEAEWLLWIDADMAWDAYALEQLLESADPKEKPIMGGLCFGRNLDGLFPTIYQLVDQFGTVTTLRLKDYPENTVFRCSATGAAFLLIHRSVIQGIADRKYNEAFPWFQETELAGNPAGEDITFCLRAELLGFPVHVDTSVKIGHHKSHLLTEDLFKAQREQQCQTAPSEQ